MKTMMRKRFAAVLSLATLLSALFLPAAALAGGQEPAPDRQTLEEVNVALYKPVSTSDTGQPQEGYGPEEAVDGTGGNWENGWMLPATNPGDDPISLYVSPNGSDIGDGSMEQPFLTLQRARDAVRLMNGNMNKDIVVYLRGGVYPLASPLQLGVADSGTNGHYVTYRNYPGETPIISGGTPIGGWIQEGGLLKTNVGSLPFRDLWVNDRRATRARTESFKIAGWNAAGKQLRVENAAAAELAVSPLQNVELVLNQHWTESMIRMNAVSSSGSGTVISLAPLGDILFTRLYPDRAIDQSVHFENAYEFLDRPGEWFLDRNSGNLFYWPREGETAGMLNARIGASEHLIAIQGNGKSSPARNIRLDGLTFEHTKYQRPITQNGIVSDQGGLSGGVRQPAAVYLKAAHQIRIERNVFRHLGASAVDLDSMTHNNTVEGNAFLDIGGSAIVEGVFDDLAGHDHSDELTHAKDNRFANNYLNGIGVNPYSSAAILSGFAQGTVIERNDISNTGYTAISAGWGWTGATTALKNTKIRYNHIYNAINRLADGAAIYTLSKTPNAEIAENFIHDLDKNEFASSYFAGAIYLDQATSGYTVRDNAMARIGEEANQVLLNVVQPGDNVLVNNGSPHASVQNHAGMQPEYWDRIPGVIAWESGAPWTAEAYGSVKVAGNVHSDLAGFAYSVQKNGTTVWSGAAAGTQASYLIHIDVLPGDIVSFTAQGNAEWSSMIKPEAYPPRLAIENVAFAGQQDAAKISSRYAEAYVKLGPNDDPDSVQIGISTPYGTEPESLASGNGYRDYRVYMASNQPYSGFAGERKYRDWRIYLIPDGAAPPTEPEVNVALGKPVTTSDAGSPQSGYEPAKAVDGIGGNWVNGWSSVEFDGIAPWLQVDLLDEYMIRRVQVDDRPYDGDDGRTYWDGMRKNFEILASNDPDFQSYTVIGAVGNEPYLGETWSYKITDPNAYRYIRFARSDTGYAFLSELRVFGVEPPVMVEENAAQGKPVSTSDTGPSLAGYGPEKAVDGIGGEWDNGWSPVTFTGMSPWLQVDLGVPRLISRVQVDDRPYDGLEGRPAWDGPRKNFEIRASNDPNFGTYTVLGSVGAIAYPGYVWSHAVTNTNAYRYIRYVRTDLGYAFLSELRVFTMTEAG
jgi:hypothetical protein